MSTEEKKSDASTIEQPSTTTEPTLSKDQKSPDKISVDIAPNVSVELDIETARKVIEHRNAKSKGYKEMESRLKEVEGAKKAAEERARLIELAKNSDFDTLKAEASREYADKLKKIEAKVTAKEIESALLSNDDFIKESLPDAIKLLKSDFEFHVNDDGDKVITKDGKTVDETVKEWLKGKDLFRKAKGANPTGGKLGGSKTPNLVHTNPNESLAKGLGKMLGVTK